MENHTQKPTKEAKALSLFLMAFKAKKPIYKEHLKRINKQWDLVKLGERENQGYQTDIKALLTNFGGYTEVVEKTVQHYINTKGSWQLNGDDQYCADANAIAAKINKLRKPKK